MHVRRHATEIEVTTPAKINLFLEVLARRADGYHEIETLLTAVTIYDSLIFTASGRAEITLEYRWALGLAAADIAAAKQSTPAHELLSVDLPGGRDNLACRAAELVRERAGIRAGATIRLIKRIPAAAGLGGASSDAAAALVAACAAWQLDWPRERLMQLAAELGSDVPFFLARGAAVGRGRGEKLESIPSQRLHMVVVRPPVGLSTPRVYQECRPTETPVGARSLIESLSQGDVPAAAKRLVNNLTPAAAASLTPWILAWQQEFANQPVWGHQMSGSGSSYFGLCRTARQSRRLAALLRGRQRGTVFAATTAVAT